MHSACSVLDDISSVPPHVIWNAAGMHFTCCYHLDGMEGILFGMEGILRGMEGILFGMHSMECIPHVPF